MIKCKIKQGNKVLVKADGSLDTVTKETMLFIREVYQGIKKENEDAAEEFRNLLFAFLVAPSSPLYKNPDDSEQPEKSPK